MLSTKNAHRYLDTLLFTYSLIETLSFLTEKSKSFSRFSESIDVFVQLYLKGMKK